jgi:hypothetical protein
MGHPLILINTSQGMRYEFAYDDEGSNNIIRWFTDW